MSKESNVVKFYTLCNKLKDIVRTGWKDWGVKRFRVESVAEHIYGVQMLAIAMWSEYKYDLDIAKVITMIAVHEIEEIVIGDLTCFQMNKEEKNDQDTLPLMNRIPRRQRSLLYTPCRYNERDKTSTKPLRYVPGLQGNAFFCRQFPKRHRRL